VNDRISAKELGSFSFLVPQAQHWPPCELKWGYWGAAAHLQSAALDLISANQLYALQLAVKKMSAIVSIEKGRTNLLVGQSIILRRHFL